MTDIQLQHLENTYKNAQPDSIWYDAFKEYNNENVKKLSISCKSCYEKVFLYHIRKKRPYYQLKATCQTAKLISVNTTGVNRSSYKIDELKKQINTRDEIIAKHLEELNQIPSWIRFVFRILKGK